MAPPSLRQTLRFGSFELDVTGYELRRDGHPVRLERQPMDLLILLVERRGELVLRADIIPRLWSKDVFVDVETGINTAVRKIRHVLSQSPEAAAFIETVPAKGYRFVAPVAVVSAGERQPPIRLAVLPFESLGPDADREYLADGLTEETIASLGHIDPEHLTVIGRTSTMPYKSIKKSLTTIGMELAVDYLVEGTIRSEGSRLRITATLNRVCDQVQVWSASYEREPASFLSVQQELSTAIAEQIRLRLSPERITTVSRRQTRNADAYDLYLRGRRFWHQLTPETTRLAVEHFSRAADLDPDYALAWAGVAQAFATSPINGDAPPIAAFARASDAAIRAMRAESGLAEAQHAWGDVNFFLAWDWPEAEAAYRRAISLDASFAFAHTMLGHLLSQSGRRDDAQTCMDRARALDPLSSLHHAMSSQVAFQARDHAAALVHAERAIAIDPEFWVGYMMRGQAYEQLDETGLALEALTAGARLSGGNSKPISTQGYVLARQGKAGQARAVIDMLEEASRHRYVPPYAIALIHAGLNEPDAAYEWLDRAWAARDVHLVFLTVDPKWDRCRTDSRFEAVLARCNFDRANIGPPDRPVETPKRTKSR